MLQASRTHADRVQVFAGLVDLAPIWDSLRAECHSLSTLSLVFGSVSEAEGFGTLLDLAIHLSESRDQSTRNVRLSLRSRPWYPYHDGGHGRDGGKVELHEIHQAAIKRHAIYNLSRLPFTNGCISVDIRNGGGTQLINAITTLKFAGERAFFRNPQAESDGWWMWKFRIIKPGDLAGKLEPFHELVRERYSFTEPRDEDAEIEAETFPNLHPTSRPS